VQMDGEGNPVHLLVNYPPKVSVSSLVNSLKGVSSYVLRPQLPRITKGYWNNVLGSPLTSPHPVAAHRSTESNATSSSQRHRYSPGLPRPEFRGLRHSLVKWGCYNNNHVEPPPTSRLSLTCSLWRT